MLSLMSSARGCRAFVLAAASAASVGAQAGSFTVSPIRADLKAGVLSETITITNDAPAKLRLLVKLMTWAQDESGRDVYTDSNDLVYFPRQLEIEPGGKRLVRVGARAPALGTERAYRLFIEEVPEARSSGQSAVSFYFRFGVAVFVTPSDASARPEIQQPQLRAGKASLAVHNPGTQHFRAAKVTFTDTAGWSSDVGGWYSLPGTSRRYEVEVPPAICRKTRTLAVSLEAEDGAKIERTLDVDPASCS